MKPELALFRKFESAAPLSSELMTSLRALPFRLKKLESGEIIVREGDRPHTSILVVEGVLFRHKFSNDGKRQITSFHISGDLPDLQSVFLRVMDHGITAAGPTRIALIPHSALLDLMKNHPDAGQILWRDTLIDASIVRECTVNIGRRRAAPRTAHLLCEFMLRSRAVGLVENEDTISFPLTQTHLADALGLSIVHVNRSIQRLRRLNLIKLQDGRLTVLDWAGMTNVAGFDDAYLHLHHSS